MPPEPAIAADPAAGPKPPSRAPVTQTTLWRRQLVLVGASAVVVVAAVGLLLLTLGLAAAADADSGALRPGPEGPVVDRGLSLHSWEMWPALLGLAAVAVVLTLTVAHTVRVAAFALRRGDD